MPADDELLLLLELLPPSFWFEVELEEAAPAGAARFKRGLVAVAAEAPEPALTELALLVLLLMAFAEEAFPKTLASLE